MNVKHGFFLNIIVMLICLAGGSDVRAQRSVPDSLIRRGDSLHMAWSFADAVQTYSKAMEMLPDTLRTKEDSLLNTALGERLLKAENGRSMLSFVYTPSVVARHMFSLEDFFLYYPLKDRSWRAVPNQLDSISGPYSRAIYAPAEDDVIYFSAADTLGVRNICHTSFADTAWTVPAVPDSSLVSGSDEIYPMLSPDGNSLFFASKGFYGVGGYDLYVSERNDDGSWSTPVNMGFPYSSPANDFLLANTEDGRYTVFASDRGCPEDSVFVYILDYDSTPVRHEVKDSDELRQMALLEPPVIPGTGELKPEMPENDDTRKYMDKMAQVRALRDSISFCEEELAEYREKYSIAENANEKNKFAEKILRSESIVPQYRKRLDIAIRELQDIEMEFLFSGVVIDPESLLAEAEREVVGTSDYVFSKMEMGEPLTLEMEKPSPENL